jgi:hypothetical protein
MPSRIIRDEPTRDDPAEKVLPVYQPISIHDIVIDDPRPSRIIISPSDEDEVLFVKGDDDDSSDQDLRFHPDGTVDNDMLVNDVDVDVTPPGGEGDLLTPPMLPPGGGGGFISPGGGGGFFIDPGEESHVVIPKDSMVASGTTWMWIGIAGASAISLYFLLRKK